MHNDNDIGTHNDGAIDDHNNDDTIVNVVEHNCGGSTCDLTTGAM